MFWDKCGKSVVHKRTITKAAMEIEGVWDREREEGFKWVKEKYPEAIHRVGCYCCYGDGPDLETEFETLPNGNEVITYTIDWDFCRADHVDEEDE